MSYDSVDVCKQFFASQKTYISLQKDHFYLPTVVLLPSKSSPFALQRSLKLKSCEYFAIKKTSKTATQISRIIFLFVILFYCVYDICIKNPVLLPLICNKITALLPLICNKITALLPLICNKNSALLPLISNKIVIFA